MVEAGLHAVAQPLPGFAMGRKNEILVLKITTGYYDIDPILLCADPCPPAPPFSSTHNPVGLWPVLQMCATISSNGASGTRIADTCPSRQSHNRISNSRDSCPATNRLCRLLTDTESANGNVQTTC